MADREGERHAHWQTALRCQMVVPIAREAGHSIEAGKRAKVVTKKCAACGMRLNDNRKTYCGPCYDRRLQENIAANRHKYRKVK